MATVPAGQFEALEPGKVMAFHWLAGQAEACCERRGAAQNAAFRLIRHWKDPGW